MTPARVCSNVLLFLGGVLGAGTGPRGGREAPGKLGGCSPSPESECD